MNERRKGWCPGALRPMRANDGYLVRLRITAGRLPATMAARIADLSLAHGDGLLDISARANLQMRGVAETSLPAVQQSLHDLGLLDATPDAESIRNVMVSPLSGLIDDFDLWPVAQALEETLVATTALHDLPGKFGFLLDDGASPSLAGQTADIRFDREPGDARFAIGLGGSRGTAAYMGYCSPLNVPARAAELASRAKALFARHHGHRRLADLRRALGDEALALAMGGVLESRPQNVSRPSFEDLVGPQTYGDSPVTGFAVPFGRLDARALLRLADAAEKTSRREIRLSPWRILFVPGTRVAALDGFITDPADPRLRIAACTGAPGCAEASRPTQTDAAALARGLSARGADVVLHVSGCPKGCAKPSETELTLVARDGAYDLVRRGRADGVPERTGLSFEAALRLVEGHAW